MYITLNIHKIIKDITKLKTKLTEKTRAIYYKYF